MTIGLQTSSPDPDLLAAVREAAWDLHGTTVIADQYVAVIGGAKTRWQVAFNEQAGRAAIVRFGGGSQVHFVNATSMTEAVEEAARLGG